MKPDQLTEFLTEVLNNVRSSQKETGVIQFDLLQQHDSPNKFMLYEVYGSMEDIESHKQTTHFKRWVSHGIPLLSSERIRTLYKKVEP